MNRDLDRLTRNGYDLVIIGGGIYGICAAWDATLRGLSVAIVDRGDFCCATSANYLGVTGFLRDRGWVAGVKARDLLTGDELEIRGKMVLNASNPWAERLLSPLEVRRLCPPLQFSKDLYLVVDRPLTKRYALAVPSYHTDPNAIVSRGQRHLFVIPWRDYTLIGSSHVVYEGRPDEFAVDR